MQVKAKLNYLRIAPRKVRIATHMVRGKKVEEAKLLLRFSLKKSTKALEKLLDSAIANAKNDFDLASENLKIAEITVDEGPKLKRWRPRSRGRALQIQKKTSHITIVLEDVKPENVEQNKKTKKLVKKEEKKQVKQVKK